MNELQLFMRDARANCSPTRQDTTLAVARWDFAGIGYLTRHDIRSARESTPQGRLCRTWKIC